jgi:Gpi18-like mannosyltransferase
MQQVSKARLDLSLLLIAFIVLLPRFGMEYDMNFWKDWALSIHQNGLSNAYNNPSINYFPVYVYGLYVYDLLHGSAESIAKNIYQIKIMFILFDFLPIVVLTCFKKKLLPTEIPYLLLLLNAAYFFDSVIWGQIDSIFTALGFLALVTGRNHKPTSALLYVLALNTKPQAIVFAPVLCLLWFAGGCNWRIALKMFSAALVTQVAILLPFLSSGGLGKLWFHATHYVNLYNNLSISAFNIWYLIAPGNPYLIKDTSIFFLFSYKVWGLLLFAIACTPVLYFTFRFLLRFSRKAATIKFDSNYYTIVFLSAGLISLYFFYFNSEMHERYAHPIILLFFFYGVVSKNYRLYFLASVPYYLSLDKCFSYPDGFLPITHYKIIYASQVLALWYTATVVYGSYLFYRNVKSVDEEVANLNPIRGN